MKSEKADIQDLPSSAIYVLSNTQWARKCSSLNVVTPSAILACGIMPTIKFRTSNKFYVLRVNVLSALTLTVPSSLASVPNLELNIKRWRCSIWSWRVRNWECALTKSVMMALWTCQLEDRQYAINVGQSTVVSASTRNMQAPAIKLNCSFFKTTSNFGSVPIVRAWSRKQTAATILLAGAVISSAISVEKSGKTSMHVVKCLIIKT